MGANGQPSNGSTIIPCLRYHDALAAIDWLQRAFGFHAQAVYADGDTVFHAQLTFGNGMIMLGSANNQSAWSEHAVLPGESVLPDPERLRDRHRCRCALCAGQGGWGTHRHRHCRPGLRRRGYACADPEGYLWWFGSYDPWREDHSQ